MKTPTPTERFQALVDADHKRYIEYEDTNNVTIAAEADFRRLARELATELEQAQLPESTRTLLGHMIKIADHASDQAHECDCFKFSLSNFSDHACPFCHATAAAWECDIKDWARLIALAEGGNEDQGN